ncbi:nucleotide-diphospho-sugar transferase [Dacryopinax primogenitus]|uniref:Translation initiation factor eIF2B subunit gamma n=1 Tax=Dacryopinax primogenitus (strain DJM 731) TaxID=1858805 RepID=M5G5V1_DACPD|nr:nucleotide-diphospho-sugar transferase [Dacryopinax primogenitus]EJU04099.1 nucleotide-diphospho-sugar transferase [Dacryopinax primogenitus]
MLFPSDGVISSKTPEFHAVILAGYGNNLDPLVDDEKGVHKALLPIGNQPMVSYALQWLEEARVFDVLFITPQSHKVAIQHHLSSQNSSWPSLRVELESVDDEEAESLGAADLLRMFADRIQSDAIVLPCDFVPPPSLPLNLLLNAHRVDVEDPVMTALLVETGEEVKDGPVPTLMGLHAQSNTLLFVDDNADPEDDVALRMNMLWRYPRVKMTNRLTDSHVYVFRRSVFDLLQQKDEISSVREQLVPFLCKLQYQPRRREKYGPIISPNANMQELALEHSTTYTPPPSQRNHASREKPIHKSVVSTPFTQSGASTPPGESVPASQAAEEPEGSPSDYPIRCNVVVHKDGYAARANTLGTYFELNRQCLRTTATAPVTGEGIDGKAQVSPDSLVGASTRIAERTTVKKCVIGKHCLIGKNVRISGSVLMDHVEVQDGAKIENCIISSNCRIGKNASLRDCQLQTGWVVDDEASHKGERLKRFEAYGDDD